MASKRIKLLERGAMSYLSLTIIKQVNSQDQGLKAQPNLEGIRAKQSQDCSSNWFPQPTRRPAQLPHVASLLYASESSAGPLSGSHGASEPPRMTPQEKIEKLRWRQQLQVLYAIQKQQKQLSTDVEESVGILPTISTNENDESNAVPMVVDNCHTMEDTILYQLQNTVSKLDFRVRISIRDSLFRLAQSAKQRQYFGDSSRNILSSNKCKGLKQDKNTRCSSRPPDVETETNPIDRGMAHLLFHRPINNFNSKPVVSLCHGSKNPDLFSERSRSDNGPCTMDTSENALSDYN